MPTRRHSPIITFALLALTVTTAACGAVAAAPVTTLVEAGAPASSQVVDTGPLTTAVGRFGVDLLRAVRAADPAKGAIVSPFSAYSALALVQGGARGATLAELRRVLHTDGLDAADVDQAYGAYLEIVHGYTQAAQAGPSATELEIANSLWIDDEVQPFDAFLDRDRQSYGANVARVDLQAPGAVDAVNQWISQQTRGHVTKLLEHLDRQSAAVLANAVYLKAPWAEPFMLEYTQDQAFHRAHGGSVVVPMMATYLDPGRYRASDTYEATHMALRGYSGHMSFYLPRTGFGPDDVLATLAEERAIAAAEPWETRPGVLSLPRFKLDWRGSLKDDLKSLGLQQAFDPDRADFGNLAPPPPSIVISQVLHAGSAEVNEVGVEAAAATVVEMRKTGNPDMDAPSPFRILLDRPFVFELELAGMSLFLGVVEDPRTQG